MLVTALIVGISAMSRKINGKAHGSALKYGAAIPLVTAYSIPIATIWKKNASSGVQAL